jgi:pimeloyl-ACP methyl ester carboxylesterase
VINRRVVSEWTVAILLAAARISAAVCPPAEPLGPSPQRLVVVTPGTGQGPAQWASFRKALESDPASRDVAWLVFDHGIRSTSIGKARDYASLLSSCISEKFRAANYRSVTLIGHSIGGMITRRAFLGAAGAFADSAPAADDWPSKVDSILLFASVNRGVPASAKWWGPSAAWLLRTFPHPQLVIEDLVAGSDFIADVRIAWIRYFGEHDAATPLPRVVQFWGTRDSVVTEQDNADLEAFSGPVVERVSDATHGDLQMVDPDHAADPTARWALFRHHLFDESPPGRRQVHTPTRVLFIARGIRDTSNSEWVTDLQQRAERVYSKENVIPIEYGWFSAAHFAFRPLRSKMIPRFRDLYAERLAREPLTTFDFIGHSNGTYILGESLRTTPSMRFRNVALAAPVLPTDFDWDTLFKRGQVEHVRYDTAQRDWPVGVLCPAIRAIGFSDVGPSGVVLFGDGSLQDGRVQKVGWYAGGHGDSINQINRPHLLAFAESGDDVSAGEITSRELGPMQTISRATPYLVWLILLTGTALVGFRLRRQSHASIKTLLIVVGCLFLFYVVLDVI